MTATDPPPVAERPGRLKRQLFRFLLGGAFNTGATLALYWALLHVTGYQAAYLVSYCAGIILSYALNTRFVFEARHTWRKFFTFPLIYLVVYALGALTLKFVVDILSLSPVIAPVISIAVTLPVSFVLTRLLLQPKA